MPRKSLTGRRFTYCSKARRMGIKSPQSETWSGTPGSPTAPRKMASESRRSLEPVVRHHMPCFAVGGAGIGEGLVLEPKAVQRRHFVEHPHSRGDNFVADAVAGDEGDFVGSHEGPAFINWA